MNVNKPSLVMKEKLTEQPVNKGTTRPKNPSANILPTEGYVLEIDGKFKSEYGSRRFCVRLFPKLLGDLERVDLEVPPPCHLISDLIEAVDGGRGRVVR